MYNVIVDKINGKSNIRKNVNINDDRKYKYEKRNNITRNEE